MKVFLITMIVLFGTSVVGKLFWLGSGNLPVRRPSHEAGDIVIGVALILWAAILLIQA